MRRGPAITWARCGHIRAAIHHEGSRSSRRVEGEKLHFEPGDYLIAPGWTWHDHANEGMETVLWMDCLQQPLRVSDDDSARRSPKNYCKLLLGR